MATHSKAIATPGIAMGPKSTYRSLSVNPQNKKALMIEGVGLHCAPVQQTACPVKTNMESSVARSGPCWGITGHQGARPESLTPLSDKKAFSSIHPYVDDGVLRCWGLRLFEVGGVQVIGWEVGMEPA